MTRNDYLYFFSPLTYNFIRTMLNTYIHSSQYLDQEYDRSIAIANIEGYNSRK